MDGRSSVRLFALGAGALLLGIIAACAAPEVPADTEGSASAVTRTFDRDNVLDDKSMRDSQAMTVSDVQKFLEKNPWGKKSVLASYKEGGKSAAQIMVDMATSHGINPIEMLVRVQMEQGLVNKTTASAATIAIAFGCGCPHSPVCSDKYMGFANQADCAAGTLRRSMDKAITTSGTVSGWARSKSKDTEDGVTIVPANAVTAALYTYTPYVGEAGGGKTGVGGVSLHAKVWDGFAEFLSYSTWAPPAATTTDEGTDSGAAPEPEPTPEPEPEPTPEPAPDAGKGADSGPRADAGPGSGSRGAPEDGSEDSKILGEGNAPPASDAPPPRAKKSTPTRPEDLTPATEAELAGKPKDSGGCSTSGQRGDTGMLLAGAVALSLLVSRRRRAR